MRYKRMTEEEKEIHDLKVKNNDRNFAQYSGYHLFLNKKFRDELVQQISEIESELDIVNECDRVSANFESTRLTGQ